MEGMRNPKGNNNNKKPVSLMHSSSLPPIPASSFQARKKPYLMNHGGCGLISSSGANKISYPPPLPSPSVHSPLVIGDNNKTAINQNFSSPPSDGSGTNKISYPPPPLPSPSVHSPLVIGDNNKTAINQNLSSPPSDGSGTSKISYPPPPLPSPSVHSPLVIGDNNKTAINQNLSSPPSDGSGTSKISYPPPLPSPSVHSPLVIGDNNKTPSSNQNLSSPPSDGHLMMIPGGNTSRTCKAEHDMDPKKLRRIQSNRESAQKSRMKKSQYILDKEKKAKSLEDQIVVLTPQLEFYKNKHEVLQMENKRLKQRLATFINNRSLKIAEREELQAEAVTLRQLFLFQQEQKMQLQNSLPPYFESGLEEMFMNSSLSPTSGLEQMVYANPNQFGERFIGESIEEQLMLNEQLNMNQVSAQLCLDDHHNNNAANTNMVMMPPVWGAEAGQMPPDPIFQPVSLLCLDDHHNNAANTNMVMMPPVWGAEAGQMPPDPIIQSVSQQNSNMMINNLNMGGIEEILNNNMTSQDPFNGLI